jgi:hypothetical protein
MYFTVSALLKGIFLKLNGDIQVHHASGMAEFCRKPDDTNAPSTKVFSLVCEVQLHVKVHEQ